MVVTDLHGDWEVYQRYRDRFVDLEATGRADYLIFTGDLIHWDQPGPEDKSLEMVLDVIALQARYGQAVIYLCGNHEMPHIYGITLAKGNRNYTPDFEAVLSSSGRRSEVMTLFDGLPFYLRTRAGVSLTHAGAPPPLTETKNAHSVFNWSHQRVLAWADEKLQQDNVAGLRQGYGKLFRSSYDSLARHYLAVSGPEDPRYDDLLRGFFASNLPAFNDLLWPTLFTRCEREYGPAHYSIFLDALLKELSVDFARQKLLVAGHIDVTGGQQVVVQRHLRLASGHHAKPRESGKYLLFDTDRPLNHINELLSGLDSVYDKK